MHQIDSVIDYASKNKTSLNGYIPFTYLIKECRVVENLKECNQYLFMNIHSYGINFDTYYERIEILLQVKKAF